MFLFFYFGLFVTVSQKKCLGNGRSGTAVFRENLVTICTHDRRLWIWIHLWISVDISMDMDILVKLVLLKCFGPILSG